MRTAILWLALREGKQFTNSISGPENSSRRGHRSKRFTWKRWSGETSALSGPKGLSVAPNGNIYFADTESHAVRMIDVAQETLKLVAGTGERGDGPEGAPLNCRMSRPHGIFVDADGAIFIGDSEAHRVPRNSSEAVTTEKGGLTWDVDMIPSIEKPEAASLKVPSIKAKNIGAVVYIYAFDVAYEMIRQPVKELLGQPVVQFVVDAGKRSPRQHMFYRPRWRACRRWTGLDPTVRFEWKEP
jgi:hypothetical protein